MGVKEKEKKKRNWWVNRFSSFGGEIECELGRAERERKLVRKRIWYRILGTKKTVPEQSDSDVPSGEIKKLSNEKKEKNHKGNNKAIMIHENQNSTQTIANRTKSAVQHKAAKCNYRTEPAPLYKMLDPVKTQTHNRLSHSDSLQTSPVTKNTKRKALCELDFAEGIFVLTVIILLVILFGKSFAILCVCVWFYVILRLRADVAEKEKEKENEIKKKNEEEMLDSEEYKRMVVLHGFLERDKKRQVRGK